MALLNLRNVPYKTYRFYTWEHKNEGGGMKKPEELLVLRTANYLRMRYPNVPYRFDQIDQISRVNGRRNKEIHGKWSRGYPDLIIFGRKRPMLLELKATKTVHVSEHTKRQAAYHAVLRKLKYRVQFVCGFGEVVRAIDKYMLQCSHEKTS